MSDFTTFLHRNLPLLGKNARHGYEWWWHTFVGKNKSTGEEKVFFVQYGVLNPGLYSDKVVLGQSVDNQQYNICPSYVMIKAGVFGENAKQIHNFYPADELVLKHGKLNFQVGSCILTDTDLSGSVSVDREEAVRYPECMTDFGTMIWNLKIKKTIAYGKGILPAKLSFLLGQKNGFFVSGAKALFSGTVAIDGVAYEVEPESSFGYADKRWGKRYSNPCMWINSSDLTSLFTGEAISKSCLLVRGGSSGKNVSVYLKLNNLVYDFSTNKLFGKDKVTYTFFGEGDDAHWLITAENKNYLLDISLFCSKHDMLRLKNEAPDGKKQHNNLQTGGLGHGELKLFRKLSNKSLEVLENVAIGHAGCAYGDFEPLR